MHLDQPPVRIGVIIARGLPDQSQPFSEEPQTDDRRTSLRTVTTTNQPTSLDRLQRQPDLATQWAQFFSIVRFGLQVFRSHSLSGSLSHDFVRINACALDLNKGKSHRQMGGLCTEFEFRQVIPVESLKESLKSR